MKKKPELDDIEVVFDSTPLTNEDKKLISKYIRQDKAKRAKKSLKFKTKKRIAA